MSLLSAIVTAAEHVRRARIHYLTEREVRSLPLEIQKDIGWITSAPPRKGNGST